MSTFGRLFDAALQVFVSLLFIALIVVGGMGVFWRYVLNQSLVWANTVSGWLFLWLTLVGAALAVRYRRHMAMSILRDSVPERFRRSVDVLIDLLIVIAGGFLVYSGWELLQRVGGTTAPALGIPQWPAVAAIPVGSFFILVQGLRGLAYDVRRQAQDTSDSSASDPHGRPPPDDTGGSS